MSRLFLAAVLALTPTAVSAELDSYASWMSGHPLSRLDWFLQNGEMVVNRVLLGPSAGHFPKDMKAKGFDGTVAVVAFDYASSQVTIDVITIKDRPTQQDCVFALDAVRDRLVTTHAVVPGVAEPRAREAAAERLVMDMAETPSKLTYPGEPPDLAAHFAKAIVVRLEFLGDPSVSCFGSLAGRDVSQRLK